MVAVTTLVAASCECYEVKAGEFAALQLCDPYLSASEASFSQWGAIQIQLPLLCTELENRSYDILQHSCSILPIWRVFVFTYASLICLVPTSLFHHNWYFLQKPIQEHCSWFSFFEALWHQIELILPHHLSVGKAGDIVTSILVLWVGELVAD